MELECYQFESEFTEEESESQNLASSPVVIVSMEEECHWIGALMRIAQFYQHSTSVFVAIIFSKFVLTSGSNYITGGSSSGGSGSAGTPYGISGGSAVFSNGCVISGGSGSAYCPPMRHDCHPSCINYDDPHCVSGYKAQVDM
ncbi:uncharacterized protein LOC144624796 [Crassostrea virginica]